jgi:uncharacterized membrane protein YbjE (DUF340 family)
VEFDPYLYVAFGAGFLAGRLLRARSPWVPRATLVSVGVLIGLFGASIASIPTVSLVETIPEAIGVVLLMLGVTAVVVLLVARRTPPTSKPPQPQPPPDRWPLSPLLLGALVVGFAAGHWVAIPTTELIPWALYALLALVAFDLKLRVERLRNLWIPVSAAVVGATVAGVILAVLAGVGPPVAFATTYAFGWYSLAGPLVAARAGAALGLLAFLTNFIREDLTMLLAPVVGPRLKGEGLAAWGGATSMDTTLVFITRYGDPEAASLALATGLIFTVSASLVLPLLLALP